jgi:hypothetical protein
MELLKGADRKGLDTLEFVETPIGPCDRGSQSLGDWDRLGLRVRNLEVG